jgi:soluble lytic murein transglycosylase-like protein
MILSKRKHLNETPESQVGHWLCAAVLVCGLTTTAPALADIYHYVGADGTSHFSDQPTDPRYRLLPNTKSTHRATPWQTQSRQEALATRRRIEPDVQAAAKASRVDAALLHAVIEVESGYNPNAVSRKGALGLMQLMPETARRYGVADPLDAAQNVHGGARHLRDLLDQFADNKELALAAYNAGAAAVMMHGRRIPPYTETIRYVPAVLKIMNRSAAAQTTAFPNPGIKLPRPNL